MKNNFRFTTKKGALRIREMVVFAMLAAVMFCSKVIMEAIPNVHLLGALTMAYTLAFRVKALIPLYLYVMINGVYAGFAPWWIPYLYIWAILWAVTMLLPRNMPEKVGRVVYPTVCCLYGLSFGVLYAPGQAWIYGLSGAQTVAWILRGIPADLLHGVGNAVAGLLILPLSKLLTRLMRGNA